MADDDSQQWLTLGARGEIAPRLQIQVESNARFSDDRGGLYQLQGIALLGYELGDGLTAWAGYVQSQEYSSGDLVVERRARQQLTLDNFAKLGPASFSARLRTEQRWRDGVEDTAWRVRPFLRASIPLGSAASPSLVLSGEAFVNLSTSPFQAQEGLERTRAAAALSIPVAKGVRMDAGYLNQHRFVRGGADLDEHALTAALNFSF